MRSVFGSLALFGLAAALPLSNTTTSVDLAGAVVTPLSGGCSVFPGWSDSSKESAAFNLQVVLTGTSIDGFKDIAQVNRGSGTVINGQILFASTGDLINVKCAGKRVRGQVLSGDGKDHTGSSWEPLVVSKDASNSLVMYKTEGTDLLPFSVADASGKSLASLVLGTADSAFWAFKASGSSYSCRLISDAKSAASDEKVGLIAVVAQ